MKYFKSIFFALAVFLYFSATSFAGLGGIEAFQYYVTAKMVEQLDVTARNEAQAETYLAMINPVNGEVTTIGKTGFVHCSGLDFNPAGELFATCQRMEEPFEPVLVKLDPNTGIGTEVGPTGITEQISDITNTGEYIMHAYEEVETPHNVHEINDMTGDSIFIGQPGIEGQGNALFFWGDEAVKLVTWVDGVNQVYELDAGTAQPTFVTNLQVFDNINGLMAPVVALPCIAFAADGIKDVDAGIMFGLNSSDASATTKGAITAFEAAVLFEMPINGQAAVETNQLQPLNQALGFIDLDGGIAVITTRIEPEYIVDGLAVRQIEPRPIPTLSEWGVIATSVLIFACGLFILIKRKRGFNIG